MEVVEPPKRVETLHLALLPLLPVHPPEINAHRFLGMMKQFEISAGEMGIGDVERDRVPGRGVDAHPPGERGVLFLVRIHTHRGVQVHRSLQPVRVHKVNRRLRIGEQVAVPGIARPAGGRVARVRNVPVHVNDADGQRNLVRLKIADELGDFVVGVFPIPAPPIAQRPLGQKGHRPGHFAEIGQRSGVVVTVPEEVHIELGGIPYFVFRIVEGAGREPPPIIKHQRAGIIHHHPPRAGEQTPFEGHPPVNGVERAIRPHQVFRVRIAVAPGVILRPKRHGQRLRGEGLAEGIGEL